jgi:hypothetical protein
LESVNSPVSGRSAADNGAVEGANADRCAANVQIEDVARNVEYAALNSRTTVQNAARRY